MVGSLFSFKYLLVLLFTLSTLYTHFRGKKRLRFIRQLTNHSTIMAPINVFMYLFSKVPTTPFLDRRQFPELDLFKDNWQVIREEAQELLRQGEVKGTQNSDDLGFNSFFKRGWKRFYLKWYKHELASAQELCPKTMALIRQVPCINAAMFTFLPSGGVLNEHRDPYAGSLRYHLGIITPNNDACYIEVDGIRYSWRDGEDVLFDETYIHSAANDTSVDRLIFFCDVARPMRNKFATAVNRFFGYYLMSEAVTQNHSTEKVGVFNRIFRYYDGLYKSWRNVKKTDARIYYTLKYTAILLIAYLLLR